MPKHEKTKQHSATLSGNCRARQGFNQYRWVVANDPNDLKDKSTLTENRKHVMHNYLDGERMKPNSTDHRILRAKNGRQCRTGRPHKDGHRNAPRNNEMRRSSSVFSSSSVSSSSGSSDHGSNARESIWTEGGNSLDVVSPHRAEAPDSASAYQQIPTFEFPSPSTAVGAGVGSFGVLPSFSDALVDTEQLQWSYLGKFGGEELAAHWIPALLKAKHAFLSTMCISTSHDDVMQRGFQAPHERTQYPSWERQKARTEVIGLINQALNDPQIQTADATIVAVLHLLNSEIMGCDDTQMKIHQEGLHQMVRTRGGIDNLGIDGRLASILTSTMYMISALRETLPHSDFIKYASPRGTKPPNDTSNLPESPVYCRPSGFHTTYHTIPADSPTASLLENLRALTSAFVQQTSHHLDRHHEIANLYNKISTLPPASSLSFPTQIAHYTYESLRLTAQVYANSIHHRVPLSRAAAYLSLSTPSRACGSPATSWHILIKQALLGTNLSDLWSHAGGTLFWIVLIAGACANPESASNVQVREANAEEEEARKWLAAVAVRCSFVLGLRHGGVVLEMLKRVVAVEQALAERDELLPPGSQTWQQQNEPGEPEDGISFYGPVEMSSGQKDMHDFAMEFLDGL